MNKYDEIIIFILLKICRILSKSSSYENTDTLIFCIQQKIDELKEGK